MLKLLNTIKKRVDLLKEMHHKQRPVRKTSADYDDFIYMANSIKTHLDELIEEARREQASK